MIVAKRIIKVLLITLLLILALKLIFADYGKNVGNRLYRFLITPGIPIISQLFLINYLLPVILLIESFFLKLDISKKLTKLIIIQGIVSIIVTFITEKIFTLGVELSLHRDTKSAWAMTYIYWYFAGLYLVGFWSILLGTKFRQLKLIGWILEK